MFTENEIAHWNFYCAAYGLKQTDLGREITNDHGTWTVSGILADIGPLGKNQIIVQKNDEARTLKNFGANYVRVALDKLDGQLVMGDQEQQPSSERDAVREEWLATAAPMGFAGDDLGKTFLNSEGKEYTIVGVRKGVSSFQIIGRKTETSTLHHFGALWTLQKMRPAIDFIEAPIAEGLDDFPTSEDVADETPQVFGSDRDDE